MSLINLENRFSGSHGATCFLGIGIRIKGCDQKSKHRVWVAGLYPGKYVGEPSRFVQAPLRVQMQFEIKQPLLPVFQTPSEPL